MPARLSRQDACVTLILEEREKFGARSRVVFESAEQTGSLHDRVLLFHAAHHHAEMLRFHHDRHARRFKTPHKRLGDLGGKILLNL